VNRFPTLFVSHGAPTWALEPGRAGELVAELGRTLPKPQAVLVVSPHWMTRGIAVSAAERPRTIHDFGGFPQALYRLRYDAPGHPSLAARVANALAAAGFPASLDAAQGFDHGAWVPLRHLYPAADVPAFQVSMPVGLDSASAWRLGEALAPLTREGVLVVGSGSLTHNLREFQSGMATPAPYATAFVEWVREAVLARDGARLRDTLRAAPQAARAHPTPEHFLPLLVAAGASDLSAPARVLDGGMTYGVISMESYVFGDNGAASPVH
jgi:4,5-DOPA dioxygenase extradiol